MAKQNKAFEFGPFRLEVRERRLTREGYTVPLRGRVFDTLYALISRHGCLVTKDELMAIIWPDSVVEETNLNHNICVLRRALGEKATGQKYVETVPRQGYRFVAQVKELDDPGGYPFPHDWEMRETLPTAIHSQSEPQSQAEAPDMGRQMPSAASRLRYRHQRIFSMLALSVLLIAGYFGVKQVGFRGGSSDSRLMLAVLPFENLSGDSSQNYVAEGLTHEITAQLGRWNTARVGVIARTSSKVYQNARKSINEIGRELGVDYVVEGSLRRNENTWRITVMLIRVKDQTQLWVANYNREVGNATTLQIEVARIVTTEIGRSIGVESDEGSPSAYSQSPDDSPNGTYGFGRDVCPGVSIVPCPRVAG